MKTKSFQLPIYKEQKKEEKTVRKIFLNKFFLWLEESKMKEIFFFFGKISLALIISGAFIFPVEIFYGLIYFSTFYSFAAPKIFLSFCIVLYKKEIFSAIKEIRKKKKQTEKTIEGVPTSELLHFLFEERSFKLEKFKKRFGLHRRIYDKIAKQLDKLGIVERGANNSRVLSERFSLEEVKSILSGVKKAKDLSLFRIFRGGELQALTPKEKEEEVEEMIKKEKAKKTREVKNPFEVGRLPV